ncbi:MAG: DUF3466 family protein [Methyloglobulus sp.]|nr:DUF3466 family protein [Methyloglobulus sp.]
MNAKLSTYHRKIAFGVLLYGIFTGAQASYRIVEITKDGTIDTGYTIYAGNQYLNKDGQVAGERHKYTGYTWFNDGGRVFTWKSNRLRILKTLGTDRLGYGENRVSGINKDGLVVGTSRFYDKNGIDQGERAVYWENGNLVNLGKAAEKLGFVTSTGAAINASGQVAGTGLLYENGQDIGTRPILWTQGKAQNLGILSVYAHSYSENTVIGMNDAGHVVGQSDYRTVLWANNTLQDLYPLYLDSNFGSPSPNAINNKDQVVGYGEEYSNGEFIGYYSFLWQKGVIQSGTINPDPWPSSFATAINDLGEVIGYDYLSNQYDYFQHAYFWSKGLMTDIGVLGVDEFGTGNSLANAINNKSQVVGYSSYYENGVAMGSHAFIYQNKTLTDLNTLLPLGSGWLLDNALAINDEGQITVHGTYTQGLVTYTGYALLTPN